MDAAMLRTAMGSTVQLPAYNYAKTYLVNLKAEDTFAYNPLLFLAGKPNSFWTYLVSSTFSGLCVCAAMQPADTALSRVYNQPTVIDGGLSCLPFFPCKEPDADLFFLLFYSPGKIGRRAVQRTAALSISDGQDRRTVGLVQGHDRPLGAHCTPHGQSLFSFSVCRSPDHALPLLSQVLTLVVNEAYSRYYGNWKAGRQIFDQPIN